jgi:hypothetical protein
VNKTVFLRVIKMSQPQKKTEIRGTLLYLEKIAFAIQENSNLRLL